MITKEWEVSIALEVGVKLNVLVLEAETKAEAKRYAMQQVYENGIEVPLEIDDRKITAVITGMYGGY